MQREGYEEEERRKETITHMMRTEGHSILVCFMREKKKGCHHRLFYSLSSKRDRFVDPFSNPEFEGVPSSSSLRMHDVRYVTD
jgi:hypothetical protein